MLSHSTASLFEPARLKVAPGSNLIMPWRGRATLFHYQRGIRWEAQLRFIEDEAWKFEFAWLTSGAPPLVPGLLLALFEDDKLAGVVKILPV